MTSKMQSAIDQFLSVGCVYAALTIVHEARTLGLPVISACTIHQAEQLCADLGQPKKFRGYIPDLVGLV